MTIDVKFYEREIAKIHALNGKAKSYREQARERNEQATILMWKLMRQTLVDVPLVGRGRKREDDQRDMLKQLVNVFALSLRTLRLYRTAANKIQTSAELSNLMHTHGVFSWRAVCRLLLYTKEANIVLEATGHTRISAETAKLLLGDGFTAQQIRKIVTAYTSLPEIQDDLRQMGKEMFPDVTPKGSAE